MRNVNRIAEIADARIAVERRQTLFIQKHKQSAHAEYADDLISFHHRRVGKALLAHSMHDILDSIVQMRAEDAFRGRTAIQRKARFFHICDHAFQRTQHALGRLNHRLTAFDGVVRKQVADFANQIQFIAIGLGIVGVEIFKHDAALCRLAVSLLQQSFQHAIPAQKPFRARRLTFFHSLPPLDLS